MALNNTGIKNVIVAGGVSANKYLRSEIQKVANANNALLSIPEFKYCTDNAAMIGAAAYPLYLKQDFADYSAFRNGSCVLSVESLYNKGYITEKTAKDEDDNFIDGCVGYVDEELQFLDSCGSECVLN